MWQKRQFTFEIVDYPVFMKLGVFLRERLTGQEALVTVKADLCSSPEIGYSDSLQSTVDYGAVIGLIDEVLRDQEVKLIETAVNDLGLAIMARFERIKNLKIIINKPILPDGVGKGAKVSVCGYFER